MRVYFAGAPGSSSRAEMWSNWISSQLFSYWDIFQDQFNVPHLFDLGKRKKTKMNEGNVQLFLDSGAFSAYTQGIDIDIQEYIAFIKEHKQHLEVYANLDVIGDPVATWKNQLIMEKAGLNPLPVFHTTMESDKWLRRYLDKGHDYIALGGMAGGSITTKTIQPMLDHFFTKHLCHADGMPKVKVHGFGMTGHSLMWRYPWYSVDSTSWVVTGRTGGIFVPRRSNGNWDHKLPPWKVQVSDRSPSKGEAGKHLATLSPMERGVILEWIEEKGHVLGTSEFRMEAEDYEVQDGERWHGKAAHGKRRVELITEPGLCNTYQMRDEINIKYYLDLEACFPEWPWAMKLDGGKRKGFGL